MKDVQKASNEIQKMLNTFDNETLEIIYRDHAKATECIKKALLTIKPPIQITQDEIEGLAYEMQPVTLMILKERGLK